MAADFALMTLMWMTDSLNVMIVIAVAIGACSSLRINVGYIYLMELMPKSHQTYVGTFWNVIEGLIIMFGPIYFWKISSDWTYLFVCGYI